MDAYSASSLVQHFHSEVNAAELREQEAALLAAAAKLNSLNLVSSTSRNPLDPISPFEIATKRTHSSMNFITPQFGPEALDVNLETCHMLETYGTEEQEKLLIEDAIYILTGIEAPLISTYTIGQNRIGFSVSLEDVDQRIEPSLRDLVLQIAQVGSCYFTVTRFVENWCSFEHGQVNQALCAAIRNFLKEYLIFVTQMESDHARGEMTLQKLWYYVNPYVQKLSCISSIVSAIEDGKFVGGQVLTVIHDKVLSMVSDAVGNELCTTLAKQASDPYFRILENWIYKGIIKDPFGDFFVSENPSCLTEEDFANEPDAIDIYWEKKYLSDLTKCPSFLKKFHEEILKAGKYLNVIRQCGKDIALHSGGKISYNVHERTYASSIEVAYHFASKTLLDVLLNDYDLMNRLISVKHYLLMSQGDFIMQFLDLTEDELRKPVEDLIETKLSSLLELALRTSSASNPFKDSIKVQLFPYTIREQMTKISAITARLVNESELFFSTEDGENAFGISYTLPGFEAFAFNYDVEWPISLILNYRALYCYQIIFRHLFFCKHVERQLCRTWIGGDTTFEKTSVVNIFGLRHKMLNFVQNLLYYMAFEVIEPAWNTFTTTMTKVQNVDDVLTYHFSFVNTVLGESMLTNQQILDKMTELFRLCLKFSDKCLGTSSSLQTTSALAHPKAKSTWNSIKNLDEKFTTCLVAFLRLVSQIVQNPDQSTKVVNIIHRMNFNGYYTKALEAEID